MNIKHVTFLINPAAGKNEPILSQINQVMTECSYDWEIVVTKKDKGPAAWAAELLEKTDLLMVYGGDGCVTEVAAVVKGSKTAMGIIPAGTANVMAKELGIPLDTTQALSLLNQGGHELKEVDMGLMNDEPFLLRVNIGIMADMVLTADRKLKENLGQLAYGITALKTVSQAEPVNYQMQIDGKPVQQSGVSLTITNSGHIGIGEFSMQPGISINDGLLDVILMKDAELVSILKIAGDTLLQNKNSDLMHWKCKEISIELDQPTEFICDDRNLTAQQLSITVVPKAIRMLIPLQKS